MFANNPFSILAESVSPILMQSFVILMGLLVIAGTLMDIIHKKNVKYFMFRIDDGQTKMMIKDGSKREVTDGYDTSYLTKEQAKDININTFPSYLSNGMTFREYALRNGGGLKPNRHPDEKSHELFTEHIYENLC